MSDTLEIFGDEFTNVTGIKATDDNGQTKTYIRPQGTKSISENGTGIDVTNYANVDVSVSGGGGLEYEEGIYEPSADINQPTINFSKTHDTLPILIMMEDISETPQSVDSSNLFFTITNWYSCFNKTPDILATYTYYARQQYAYTNNSGTSFTATGYNINSLNSASSSGMGFWLTTSAFMPRGGTNTYWRAGRTYKWIAVWSPTT